MSWLPRASMLGAIVALTLLGFQNCSKTSIVGHTQNASTGTNTNLNGNGVGYDGDRPYVSLAASICADGSKFQTEIDFRAGIYTLLRQNCHSVQPTVLASSQVVVDSQNPDVLYFSGEMLSDNQQSTSLICEDTTFNDSFYVMQAAGSMSSYGLFMTPMSTMSTVSPLTATESAGQSVYTGSDSRGDQFKLTVNKTFGFTGSYQGTLNVQFVNESVPLNTAVNCY